MPFEQRDLIKQPLSATELRALAKRVAEVRELVKPINQKDVEGMTDADVVAYLAENPNSVRRPIIDIDGALLLGFRPPTKKALEEALRRSTAPGAK